MGGSADGGIVGEGRSGLAAVLADLGFKNLEQAASGEWQKQPTELQIRCQEAEGVANMLMRELQEARAQTAAMGERLQQRMGPRGHHPNNHLLPWDAPRGPPMPQMYRGQTPPNHTWGPPSSGPPHFSPFREGPHDRPTAPPLPPGEGIHQHFGGPTGMPNERQAEWQAGPNRENEDGPPPPPILQHQGGGMRGGPQRFLRPMGGGGRMPPQGSVSGAASGEQDLGSLIRDLQQRYASDGSGGAGPRHSSSLIPSSVIMSAQGRDEPIRPAAAPAPLSKPGGGGDEAWADEVIMYRGFSS